ncbi:hypothetical protein [Oleisolibacter albus]|uniref:hypothetical protein n=1 Tax=Oleisolibacter albus TaxID=2171757 RepID=UPI000DF227FA|nr:hypothetical protein [Oleisolibacter albus]
MLGLVAAGFGIGITSAASTAIAFPGIVFRPMAGPESLLQLAAAWVPSNPNPVLRRFLSFSRVQLQRRGS